MADDWELGDLKSSDLSQQICEGIVGPNEAYTDTERVEWEWSLYKSKLAKP